METKYPTLRRSKKKLCFLTNKDSPSKWTTPLTLGDVEKLFDDLEPSSHVSIDLLPPSPLRQTFDAETNQCEREASPVPLEGQVTEKLPKCKMDPKQDVLHPATRSPSPKLNIGFDIPFKAHMPVKTSSPIEGNVVVPNNEKYQVVSPVLFASEDQGKENAKMEPPLIQKPQCNSHATEESDDFGFESPPNMVVISKPQMSSHKKKEEGSSKESHPVKEKTPKKPVLDSKRKTPRSDKEEPPVSAVRQESELTAPQKKTEKVHKEPSVESTCVRKDLTAFLRQLREAGQPKPASSRTSLQPVKAPAPPPEPEDDFLILEDDQPLWISIPSKTATSKKQRQSRTSSSDKDSSADTGTKDSPPETASKQQESEPTKIKLGGQTVQNQKTKKVKEKEKKNEVTEPENDKDELPSPEDLPAGDLMEEEKPNKKKQRLKKVPSKESEKEEEQPKDGASGGEKPSLKTEKQAQKSSDTKRSTPLKVGNENARRSRAKPLKGGRKVTQGSDAVKQTRDVEAEKEQSPSSEERAEDLGPPSDKEIKSSETEKDLSDEKDKHKKLEVGSEESSSEGGPTLGKRKRRQPGEWWLDHRITEETKVTDNQVTLKKSKQNNQEPNAAAAALSSPPVRAKKDRVLKKRNTTRPQPSSSQKTDIAKEKKTKQNKNKNTRGDTGQDKVIHTTEAEQQEQQEVPDQDLDVHSPLVLTHRGHSLNSGEQVFPKAYHNASNEKLSITPAPVTPGPREQLRAAEPERRRRKHPGNWWLVDNMHENVESISSQQQQQTAKPRKDRKKQSQLGTPKNGNVAVSSKPAGGAPVQRLEMAPLSGPKTVKRSLATFKDIFTSVTETPTAGQRSRRKVAVRPAEEVTVTDCLVSSMTDGGVFSVDAGELSSTQDSPPALEFPQDSKCQSEDRSQPFRSGPSSMIELEEHEEDDDLVLIPPTVPAALSVSDLCAAPLRPLILQDKDKDNLTEWFKSLWSNTVDNRAEVTPDQFDWYFYQGRALGIQVDLNDGSFCNGKILLGSYMKKPLWVDHSATTVFNVLTSSVSVTIDSKESRFHPGQSFMVPCGHAYSLQNVTAQPAVLYFTRMSAEGSD